MKRLIPIGVLMILSSVALPAMGQEDALPDQIDPTVVDFGSTTGVSDPAILLAYRPAGEFPNVERVVAFAEADAVKIGTLTDSGFQDWEADLPQGTPTALNGAQDQNLDGVWLVALTTPGPVAHLFSVSMDGSAEELISKPGYRTTGGGGVSPETIAFPIIAEDGSHYLFWGYDGNVREDEEPEEYADIHDVAIEWVEDDYGTTFVLHGVGDVRTVSTGREGSDSVEVPGAPEEMITTTYGYGPIAATVGSAHGDEADLYMYRYELRDDLSLGLDPGFAAAPQSNLGESTRNADLVALPDSRLLSAFTGGGADQMPIIDLFDPDGHYLDSYLFDTSLLVDDVSSRFDFIVDLVGSDPNAKTYRALSFAPYGRFRDDNGSVHEQDIEAIAELGITFGCNPPGNTFFCPDDSVTRGQMAGFLARTFDLKPAGEHPFNDTDGSVFVDDITAIAEAGITLGCNPPDNDEYCPTDDVTREEMAGFLARAFELEPTGESPFNDTDGSVFVDDITAIAEAGITLGCNPPDNDMYCPSDEVTRAQMASFLIRGLTQAD